MSATAKLYRNCAKSVAKSAQVALGALQVVGVATNRKTNHTTKAALLSMSVKGRTNHKGNDRVFVLSLTMGGSLGCDLQLILSDAKASTALQEATGCLKRRALDA